MDDLQIGWAGLGNMGTPIVKNLLKAGFSIRAITGQRKKKLN